ncbi:hypothetical protein NDA13_006527 [Ustilago tritici]|nr:hypothetical protein NDA13_006527 [Ustilago tritici]
MADATASTSASPAAAAGGGRKRARKVRKRSKKNKPATGSNNPNESDSDSSSEDEAPSKAASTPKATSSKASANPAPAPKPSSSAAPASQGLSQVNLHKPSFITRAPTTSARKFTISVAIPGSIVLNAQSPELQSRLAAHIARACAIFNVDEIVVFNEGELRSETSDPYQHRHNQQHRGTKRRYNEPQKAKTQQEEGEVQEGGEGEEGGKGGGFEPHTFLARVLQYLETPQYLRKALFPMHRDLRLAGLMPPLDCPHHLRFEDISEYREGVTVDTPHWARNRGAGGGGNSVYVNIGLRDPIEASLPTTAKLESGVRVTVRMPINTYEPGSIVSPREPVERLGWYWGYSVRLASSLSSVLTSCPFSSSSGYDLVIGTSERGVSLADLVIATSAQTPVALPSGETIQPLPSSFNHALVVFGGLSGLEVAVEQDEGIKLDRHTAKDLFDAWVNVVENQGSRTVRTEEAIMIALARLKPILEGVAENKK